MSRQEGPQGMNFVAIDFEMANARRASICQIGLIKVINGVPGNQFTGLVTPPPGHTMFTQQNTRIHGITSWDVKNAGGQDMPAPGWPEMLERLWKYTHNGALPLVAHNASVERSGIEQATAACGLEIPFYKYLCTVKLAKRWLPDSPNNKLDTLIDHLALGDFQHHDAGEDARATALMLMEIARRNGVDSLGELWPDYQWQKQLVAAGR